MPRPMARGRAWGAMLVGGMAHAASLAFFGLDVHLSELWSWVVLALPGVVLGGMVWRATRRWWIGAALAIAGVIAIVAGWRFNAWTHGGGYVRSEGLSIVRTLLVACGTFHVLALGSLVVWRRHMARITGAMAGVCRSCGYRLAGLPSGVCPECGSKIVEVP